MTGRPTMKATCHAVHLWPKRKEEKKRNLIHFNSCPPSFCLLLFLHSLSFLFFCACVFSSSIGLPTSRQKKRNERETEAQGEGRNALSGWMIDPFGASSLLPFRSCMCQRGTELHPPQRAPPAAQEEAAENHDSARCLIFSLRRTES